MQKNSILSNPLFIITFVATFALQGYGSDEDQTFMPLIDGDWWRITSKPELPSEYAHPNIEPVDFSVWQAADGTWQLVSCIRNSGPNGNMRIFYRWEAQSLFDENWIPMGVFMTSDTSVGEQEGGWLQAPHVVRIGSVYKMYYGGGGQICLAESEDGKTFTRVLNENGQSRLFVGEELPRARDAMFLESNGTYYLYYTGHLWPDPGANFARTATALDEWGDEVKVAQGGIAGGNFESAECPFVVEINNHYYFFRTQQYTTPAPQTTIYRSPDPLYFGIHDDQYRLGTLSVAAPEIIQHEGEFYIAALMPDLSGMRMAKIVFPENVVSEGWHGYPVDDNGWADTGSWMGALYVAYDPWIYSTEIGWFYAGGNDGNWFYIPSKE